jgi:hypothetical protein
MLTLLLAGQIAAAPPPMMAPIKPWPFGAAALNDIPAACRLVPTAVADKTGWPPRLRRLGDLPRANLEIAVHRTVGGCPAPLIVRYDVDGAGSAGGR